MKKILLTLLSVTACVYAYAQAGNVLKLGDKVPDLAIELTDGTSTSISALAGNVVVLNFWATWCPPCKAELKRVQAEIVDRFAGEDFVFIAVSVKEDKKKVLDFREENGYRFKMALDPEAAIFKSFPSDGSIPFNVIIDREGKLYNYEKGYNDKVFAELKQKINAAILETQQKE